MGKEHVLKDAERGQSLPTHARFQTSEDLVHQLDSGRAAKQVDTMKSEHLTPSAFYEGTTAVNDKNYNTEELRKEVEREVAQIKAFFMPIEEEKVALTPSKVR